MGVDAVLRAVEVEGGLGALVQYGASGHKGDLGGGPTHVQGAHQGPLQRPDPFSREGILRTDRKHRVLKTASWTPSPSSPSPHRRLPVAP